MATLKQHSERVWLVEVDMAIFDVRGAVILGDRYAVVWDTLSHPDDMREVNALIGDLPFYVVYSHADWDHIWGNAGFEKQPLAIIAHQIAFERFSTDVPQRLARQQAEEPHRWDAVRLVPPTMHFDHQMTLDLGGISLELHALAGHTKDCIIGFVPELGIWLGGDTIETPLPVIEERADVDGWVVALEKWSQDARVQHVIPSHGMIGNRDEIRKTYDYLFALLHHQPLAVPADMTEFYQSTHQANLAIMQE